MRAIKFRAWDKDNKEMLALIALRDETGNVLMQRTQQPKTIIRNTPGHVEIMQFIGMVDKNGKDIYEGDIVRWKGEFLQGEYHIYFDDERASFIGVPLDGARGWLSLNKNIGTCTIIGNIYESESIP